MIPRYTLPPMGDLFTDEARYARWLDVELAVCEVLSEDGQIPASDMEEIRRRARFDVGRIDQIEAQVGHDVIAFVTSVGEAVGPAARHVHRGLTSSDVVDTALALTLSRAVGVVAEALDGVLVRLEGRAREHAATPCIGRTHGVHAEPTTFGFKLALYVQELRRHRARLSRARDSIRVGKLSGPIGTYPTITPAVEARVLTRLGLAVDPITNQVVQRDRHAELVFALAALGATVEKFALEVRHLARTEVAEVLEPFTEGQKGSSAMPHKRNPVICERLCGLARLLRSHVAVALENVALWHERDISHSSAERVVIPDAFCAIYYMLVKWAHVLDGWEVRPERMRANLEATGGAVHSSRVLVALTTAGMSREEAYGIVQRHAFDAMRGGPDLHQRLAADPRVLEVLVAEALAACFDLAPMLAHVPYVIERALSVVP